MFVSIYSTIHLAILQMGILCTYLFIIDTQGYTEMNELKCPKVPRLWILFWLVTILGYGHTSLTFYKQNSSNIKCATSEREVPKLGTHRYTFYFSDFLCVPRDQLYIVATISTSLAQRMVLRMVNSISSPTHLMTYFVGYTHLFQAQ